jgi:hypothetical protein
VLLLFIIDGAEFGKVLTGFCDILELNVFGNKNPCFIKFAVNFLVSGFLKILLFNSNALRYTCGIPYT